MGCARVKDSQMRKSGDDVKGEKRGTEVDDRIDNVSRKSVTKKNSLCEGEKRRELR